MYKPVKPRPKKTSITRSRSGCERCRQRRKKCDQQKPQCEACKRLGHSCNYGQDFQFRSVFAPVKSGDAKAPTIGEGRAIGTDSAYGDIVPLPRNTPISTHPDGRSVFRFRESHLIDRTDQSELTTQDDQDQLLHPFAISPSTPMSLIATDRQLLYLKSWNDHCIPALPPIIKSIANINASCLPSVVSSSMLALSAFRLSRLHPQENHASSDNIRVRPSQNHWIISQQYYSTAIQEVVRWTPADKRLDAATVIQAVLLFCCLETAAGNFDVFQLHSNGIQALVVNGIQSVLLDDREKGLRLLKAWAQANMHSWWCRTHFSTPRYTLSDVSFRVAPPFRSELGVVTTTRTSVLANLCESYRLSLGVFIHRLDGDEILKLQIPSITDRNSSVPDDLVLSIDRLKDQSVLLDIWHDHRTSSELPMDMLDDKVERVCYPTSKLKVKPLSFNNHDAAMSYAYYATSRLIQTACGVESSPNAIKQALNYADSESDTELWSQLLLRITAGLDWKECLHLNPFTIGLSGLILTCALCSSDPDVCQWLLGWIEQNCDDQSLEEGSFPVSQAWRSIRLVNAERAKGYDVVAIFHPDEDAGRQGKHNSYQNQLLWSVRVLRRRRDDGSYEMGDSAM